MKVVLLPFDISGKTIKFAIYDCFCYISIFDIVSITGKPIERVRYALGKKKYRNKEFETAVKKDNINFGVKKQYITLRDAFTILEYFKRYDLVNILKNTTVPKNIKPGYVVEVHSSVFTGLLSNCFTVRCVVLDKLAESIDHVVIQPMYVDGPKLYQTPISRLLYPRMGVGSNFALYEKVEVQVFYKDMYQWWSAVVCAADNEKREYTVVLNYSEQGFHERFTIRDYCKIRKRTKK